MPRSRARRYLPPPSRFLAYSAVSSAMGMLVVLVMGVGRPGFYGVGTLGAGAVLGFCLNAGATLAEALLFAALGVTRAWSANVRFLLSTLAYFVGGGVGYLVAREMAGALGLGTFDLEGGVAATIPVFGLVTVAVGLAFWVTRRLQGRLAASVARIKEQEYAEKELETARALQDRLLPPPRLEGPGYRIEARTLPARSVAGDFYDVFRLPGDALGVAVGDVAGKGMAASLLMASVKAMLPLVAADRSVAQTLTELNRRLARDLGAREFVALGYVRYEPATGRAEIGNAGLPDPYRLAGRACAVEIPGPRLPLGARAEVDYASAVVTLAPGEALFLLSDGLPEAPRPDGSPLGYEEFARLLARRGEAGGEWLDGLIEEVRRGGGEGQEDDWTALLLERTARA